MLLFLFLLLTEACTGPARELDTSAALFSNAAKPMGASG
jgi:hypothetical protein